MGYPTFKMPQLKAVDETEDPFSSGAWWDWAIKVVLENDIDLFRIIVTKPITSYVSYVMSNIDDKVTNSKVNYTSPNQFLNSSRNKS